LSAKTPTPDRLVELEKLARSSMAQIEGLVNEPLMAPVKGRQDGTVSTDDMMARMTGNGLALSILLGRQIGILKSYSMWSGEDVSFILKQFRESLDVAIEETMRTTEEARSKLAEAPQGSANPKK